MPVWLWIVLGGVAGGFVLVGIPVYLTFARRRRPSPCPWYLRFLLENPVTNRIAGAPALIKRARIEPGMRVLDVGCGPGRLTIPIARRLGAAGRVVALDVQEKMLAVLRGRVATAGLTNVEMVLGGAGQGAIGRENAFDRAVLVTVLGEIPEKAGALAEILGALKPGGILSVTEMRLDPDYQSEEKVRRLCSEAGFEFEARHGGRLSFTLNFKKRPT
jgi:SAM-dependent methyltransferase